MRVIIEIVEREIVCRVVPVEEHRTGHRVRLVNHNDRGGEHRRPDCFHDPRQETLLWQSFRDCPVMLLECLETRQHDEGPGQHKSTLLPRRGSAIQESTEGGQRQRCAKRCVVQGLQEKLAVPR